MGQRSATSSLTHIALSCHPPSGLINRDQDPLAETPDCKRNSHEQKDLHPMDKQLSNPNLDETSKRKNQCRV